MSFTSFLYCSMQNRVIELYLWKPPGICVLFDVLTCLWQRNQTRNGSLRSLIIVLLLFYFGLICGKMTKGVWLSSSYFGFALAACVLSFFSLRELAQILDHFIFDLGFVFSHPAVFAILLSGLCAFLCLSVLLPFLSFEHISLSTYNRLVSGWCLILGFLATSFKTLPLLSVGLLALEFVSFSSAGFRTKSAQLAGECWEVGQRVDVGVSVRVRKMEKHLTRTASLPCQSGSASALFAHCCVWRFISVIHFLYFGFVLGHLSFCISLDLLASQTIFCRRFSIYRTLLTRPIQIKQWNGLVVCFSARGGWTVDDKLVGSDFLWVTWPCLSPGGVVASFAAA